MKSIAYLGCLILFFTTEIALAQSGLQDSVLGGGLRPRRDTYIIETYPSPARHGQRITLRYYNHNPELISLKVFDASDRLIEVLQQQQLMPNGIHDHPFFTYLYASGSYHIRLTRYSSDGTELSTEDSRFIVVK
ncbi:MAG TPA: hypothetical protein VFO76_11680 [Candidatus Kapabacteria bacterium]|nr:hypothetical protein [Candidatus Kapabacteria bacterium]